MKSEIVYRHITWVSALLSIMMLIVMIGGQQKRNVEKRVELKTLSNTEKMTDLIANKMM